MVDPVNLGSSEVRSDLKVDLRWRGEECDDDDFRAWSVMSL